MIALAAVGMCLAFVGLGLLSLRAWRSHAAREREMARLAAANGFAFSHDDVSGVSGLPLGLLQQGDGRMATNVISGFTPKGLPARVFDFAYWEETEQPTGGLWDDDTAVLVDRQVRKRWYRYSCAVLELPTAWPHLVIDPERFGRKLLNKLGLPDVDVESEAFNRSYAVTCDDREFAEMVLDPRVIDLVLGTDKKFRFEIKGRWLLAATERVPSHLALPMITLAAELYDRIPGLVRSEYPEVGPPDDGPAWSS